jgi:hypothetical protein
LQKVLWEVERSFGKLKGRRVWRVSSVAVCKTVAREQRMSEDRSSLYSRAHMGEDVVGGGNRETGLYLYNSSAEVIVVPPDRWQRSDPCVNGRASRVSLLRFLRQSRDGERWLSADAKWY